MQKRQAEKSAFLLYVMLCDLQNVEEKRPLVESNIYKRLNFLIFLQKQFYFSTSQ
ncbi:hypothetical protein X808_18090 [Mannheimia varigena USDA-ARS-USMARC-1296]|uniref:Uncharacterized protein n=1 Tax=Mannheimia varigena USDA-ARS-USMARC-1296 TaxID=1433287 RepID=W0QBR1_9PAST|nr:hypothetical protein X808_18090 [Mannheimia varigena USDA-ARS-USMARC-1296]